MCDLNLEVNQKVIVAATPITCLNCGSPERATFHAYYVAHHIQPDAAVLDVFHLAEPFVCPACETTIRNVGRPCDDLDQLIWQLPGFEVGAEIEIGAVVTSLLAPELRGAV